jgi:hypothetical protein
MAILDKEIRSVAKEKTIMLAIIIQLLIASTSSFLLFGLMTYYDPSTIGDVPRSDVYIGVTGDTDGTFVRFLQEKGVRYMALGPGVSIESAIRSGSVDAVVYIPEETLGANEMRLYMPESDTGTTIVTMVLKEPLQRYEDYLREKNGVDVKYTDIKGKPHTTYEFLYSFIVTMLMLFPAFIAGSIVIDAITEELENKTLETLLSAPVSLLEMYGAKAAAAIFIAGVQCVLWSILLYFNHIYIQNLPAVLLLAVIIAAFITISAAIIALWFHDRERSQFIYSISLMIFGGASLYMDPSPISLLIRLATGDPYAGYLDLLIYIPIMAALFAVFYVLAKKTATLRA